MFNNTILQKYVIEDLIDEKIVKKKCKANSIYDRKSNRKGDKLHDR